MVKKLSMSKGKLHKAWRAVAKDLSIKEIKRKSDSLKAKLKETRVFKTFVLQHWLSDLD